MPYALLDDTFHSHPKLVASGWAARGLYAAALSYCAAYLTDGFVPGSWIKTIGAGRIAERLALHGLWIKSRAAQRFLITASDGEAETLVCPENGYVIQDYLEYNPSRRQIEQKRLQKAIAGKRGAQKRWHSDNIDHGTRHSETMAEPIAPAIAPAMADGQQMLSSPRASVARPLPLKNEEPSVPSVREEGFGEKPDLATLTAAATPPSIEDGLRSKSTDGRTDGAQAHTEEQGREGPRPTVSVGDDDPTVQAWLTAKGRT